MGDTILAVHTIGQTPRPDLTQRLEDRLGAVRLETTGALDGLDTAQLPARTHGGYPLETRLRDRTRVVIDVAFLEPRLQGAIDAWDGRAHAHLLLCAGPFPRLAARKPLVRPFEVAVARLFGLGLRSLEVVVPFRAQAGPAARKWRRAGFGCRAHVLGEKRGGASAGAWLDERLGGTHGDAVVLDYVGLPPETRDELAAETRLPMFDVGRLAEDDLERLLERMSLDR